MCGFLIGSICLAAFAFMARRRCGWRHGGCGGHGGGGGCHGGGGACHGGGGWRSHWHGGGWGRHGGWGAQGPGIPPFALHWVFRQLEATPGQERVIAQAAEDIRKSVFSHWEGVRTMRDDVARAMRGELFDEETVKGAFAKQNDAFGQTQTTVTSALKTVFDALDPAQRQRLADLIAFGPRGAYGNQGPYRGY